MKSKNQSITVIAGIVKNEDLILVARRAKHKSHAGYWEFPGGKIEIGETAEMCLKRELWEELQIEVNVESHFIDVNHFFDFGEVFLRSFFCRYVSGEILLKDHDEFIWVSLKGLTQYDFVEADIPIVNALLSLR